MLAVHAMSSGVTAIVYFLALAAFVVGVCCALPPKPRTRMTWWPPFIAAGLALCTFVLFWNAWAKT